MDKKKRNEIIGVIIAVIFILLAVYGAGALIGIHVDCCH